MPAPNKPNTTRARATASANARVRRAATAADLLRADGWAVTRPAQPACGCYSAWLADGHDHYCKKDGDK